MPIPNQSIGLTNFSWPGTACPQDPNQISAIVFTPGNYLAVTEGAATTIQIPLGDFFVPVDNSVRLSFSIPPASSSTSPFIINKLDLSGIDTQGGVKFLCLMPEYGTSSSDNSSYIEWTYVNSIDNGELSISPIIGPSGNTNFDFFKINKMAFTYGGYMDYYNNGNGSIFAATNGGLLEWNGKNTILRNTLNSNLTTDYMNSMYIDAYNDIWIASNQGVLLFNSKYNSFSTFLNADNTNLPSNNVIDIKLYGNNGVVVTDKGMAIFDIQRNVGPSYTYCNVYNVYNSPLLKHKQMSCVEVLGNSIVVGTTGGAYLFNTVTNTWNNNVLNSSTVSGWTDSNQVNAIISNNGYVFIGTDSGVNIFSLSDVTGNTVPYPDLTSSYIDIPARSLKIDTISDNNYSLLIGTINIDNGLSYVIEIAFSYDNNNQILIGALDYIGTFTNDISDMLVTNTIGSTSSRTVFLANNIDSGICKYEFDTSISLSGPSTNYIQVPDSTTNADLILAFPGGATSYNGNYHTDYTNLYSIEQPMYFLFSKNMTGGLTSGVPVESFINLYSGITGTGATVSGSYLWNSTGNICTFTPNNLQRASGYNLTLSMGGQSLYDNTYISEGLDVGFYTQNIEPVLGWNSLGKMLVLSGTDNLLTKSIYLRNTLNVDVNIIGLIGN